MVHLLLQACVVWNGIIYFFLLIFVIIIIFIIICLSMLMCNYVDRRCRKTNGPHHK
jgi:hypothetical protein